MTFLLVQCQVYNPLVHDPPRHSRAKGFEVGCELGYYTACCRAWLEVAKGPNPAGSEK